MGVVKSSLQEVNEIILLTDVHEMSIPSSTQEKVESVPHPYGKAPFYTYMLSLDGEEFFPPAHNHLETTTNLFVYTDDQNVYFHYFFSNLSDYPAEFTYYISYKLYMTEAVK